MFAFPARCSAELVKFQFIRLRHPVGTLMRCLNLGGSIMGELAGADQ